MVNGAREHLEKFGGHHSAIGLSLEEKNLEAFKQSIQENYKKGGYTPALFDPDIVGELSFQDVTFELTNLVKQYEPYGQGNPTPKYISKNVELLQADTMGKEAEHLRFNFAQNGITLQGVKFKTKEKFDVGCKVDVIYTVNENHFRGNVTLQLMIEKVLVL